MKCVLLGGTGYLGRKLVTALVNNNHQVLCLVRNKDNLNAFNTHSDHVSTCMIDDYEEMLKSGKRYDCLINCACLYARDGHPEEAIFDSNCFTPLKICIISIRYGISKIMTIDTGLPSELNAYAFSKKILSDSLIWYCKKNPALVVCNIKLENYYGENEPASRFIPHTIQLLEANEPVLLTAGTQLRDFIYINDVINSLIYLLEKDYVKNYNDIPLGTGEGVTIVEFVNYLKELVGSKSVLHFGAIDSHFKEPDSIADKYKMKEYGVHVEYTWKDGIKKVIDSR